MIRSLFAPPKPPPIRAVQLFFSADRVILAPMHQNADGIYFEQATPIVLTGRPTAKELGAAFQSGFESFSMQERDLREVKLGDWPALRASGLRSAKAFKNTFKPMQCFGVNSANIIVRAVMQHPDHEDIELSVSFNPLLDADAVGEKLLHLARVAAAI